jgi:hypothetical protein
LKRDCGSSIYPARSPFLGFTLACLIFTPWAALAAPSDLDILHPIQTSQYNPSGNFARSFRTAANSFGLMAAGDLYRDNMLDIQGQVTGVLSDPDLAPYFPTAESRTAVAEPIARTVNEQILDGKMNNDKVVSAVNYTVTQLAGIVLERAMDGEGQTDKARRAIWIGKILAPFRFCIGQAHTYNEAQGCETAFQKDFRANLGLALTYELARQDLGDQYVQGRLAEYLKCVNPAGKSNGSIRDCALGALRSGVKALVGDQLRLASAQRLPKGSSVDLVAATAPALSDCLAKAGDRDSILACTDTVEITAGQIIVKETVLRKPEITSQVADEDARRHIGESGAGVFATCMRGIQHSGQRDDSGMLPTDRCESVVTNSVAKDVSLVLFENNIRANMPGKDSERQALLASVQDSLNSCWKDDASTLENSKCLRTEIERSARIVADRRLSAEISKALAKKQPDLRSSLATAASICLEQRLPADLITSPDTAGIIDSCSAATLRNAALKIAEFSLRSLTEKNLPPEQSDSLIETLVQKDFSSCLGDAPNNALVDSCSAKLQKSAGIEIAKAIFPVEIDKFVQGAGGIDAIGLTRAEIDEGLATLLGAHDKCIRELPPQNGSSLQPVVNCFKTSMASAARLLAFPLFHKMAGKNLTGKLASQLPDFETRFEKDFTTCLAGKNPPGSSAEAFKAGIDDCSSTLSTRYASLIGKARLHAAIEDGIDPSAQASVTAAHAAEQKLDAAFDSCLASKGKDSAGRALCASRLEKNATLSLVLIGETAQLRAQLGTNVPPAEIKATEATFRACLSTSAQPQGCARDFVLKFAAQLGLRKLHSSLSGAMGTSEYAASRSAILAIETSYQKCLGDIQSTGLDQALLKAVSLCSQTLQDQSVAFIQERARAWMQSKNDNASVRGVKDEIAQMIPCLAAMLPSTPMQESPMAAANPQGMLKILAGTIGDYINYDADHAQSSIENLVLQVAQDLSSAGPAAAREDLVKMLSDQGMLDQLAKALVLKEIQSAIGSTSATDRPSAPVRSQLLSKANLDRILSPAALAGLRPVVAEKILKPMLLNGQSLNSPQLQAAKNQLKQELAGLLLRSPYFGGAIVKDGVQRQLSQQDGLTTFFANLLYGSNALDWNRVRQSPKGQIAEAFIRDQILKPRFLGTQLSPAEDASRRKQAEDLIKSAIENG